MGRQAGTREMIGVLQLARTYGATALQQAGGGHADLGRE
jgi:hypothetical protein